MTALVLLILSLGVVSSNAHHTLMTVMTSNSVGGAMARRLLPASLLIPIVLGFLRLKGQDAGWFGPALGLVLHVVATMLLLALFIWWNAPALDRIARENGRFEHAVQDTQAALTGDSAPRKQRRLRARSHGKPHLLQCRRRALVWNYRRRCAAARISTQVITPQSEAASVRSMLVQPVDRRRAPPGVLGSAHQRRGAGVRGLDDPDVRPSTAIRRASSPWCRRCSRPTRHRDDSREPISRIPSA